MNEEKITLEEIDRMTELKNIGRLYSEGGLTKEYVIEMARFLLDTSDEIVKYLATLNIEQ